MTTISDGVTTVTPALVTGYSARARTRNVQHDIIGRAAIDVSLQPATLRSGRLEALCASKADAWSLHTMLSAATTFALADVEVPEVDMTFVLDDEASVDLEDETRDAWLVSFGFQEVLP